jgi:hypothetical protein
MGNIVKHVLLKDQERYKYIMENAKKYSREMGSEDENLT